MDLTVRYLLIAALAIAIALSAYMTRYQPLPGGEPMGILPLWDRWFHQVCFVIFANDNRIVCAMDATSGKSDSAETSAAVLAKQIQEAREGGYTDEEIVDYLLEQPR